MTPLFSDPENGRNFRKIPGRAPMSGTARRATDLVSAEIQEADRATHTQRNILRDFRAACVDPFETTVTFSGGLTQTCWTVTRSDGAYRVVYMPRADYFSLCAESDFGPLDIGVHGPAMGCFAAV